MMCIVPNSATWRKGAVCRRMPEGALMSGFYTPPPVPTSGIGMGRHLNCGGDFGAERRCFGELSKKQDDNMDNLKGSEVSPRRLGGLT